MEGQLQLKTMGPVRGAVLQGDRLPPLGQSHMLWLHRGYTPVQRVQPSSGCPLDLESTATAIILELCRRALTVRAGFQRPHELEMKAQQLMTLSLAAHQGARAIAAVCALLVALPLPVPTHDLPGLPHMIYLGSKLTI